MLEVETPHGDTAEDHRPSEGYIAELRGWV